MPKGHYQVEMSARSAVIVFFVTFGCLNAEILKIGAVFDKPNSKQERALRVAIDEINEGDSPHMFEAVVAHIEYDNAYQAMLTTCSLLERGVVGILGPVSEDNSNVVQSICDLKEIPHIEVRWDDYPLNGTIVNMHPYPDILTRTYLDLIDAWGWRDFVILYENNESLQRVSELLKLLDPVQHRIVIRRLNPFTEADNYRPVLKEVWKSGATHFLLDCSLEILADVLQQAQQIGLMTDKTHFIITNLDFHTLELNPYQYSETNITGMRFVDPENAVLKKVAMKIHDIPKELEELAGWSLKIEEALTYDAVMMFAEAIKTAGPIINPVSVNCNNNNETFSSGTSIVNFMKNIEYPGLTGNVKFDIRGFRSNFGLDLEEIKAGGITPIGTWNSSANVALNITRIYPKVNDQDFDIRNQTFTVITTMTEPYGMQKESSTPLYGNDRYEGFAMDLIHELSQMRGFNYTFIIREDKQNGKLDNVTGKWSGMIGDVIDGTADLAITDLTVTYEREEGVDFTSPFMTLGISILYEKPKKTPPSFFSFADPFAFEVWKLLMAGCLGVSLVLFVVGRISPSEWENPYPCIEEPEYLVNQMDLRNCVWFMTGSILQQGSEIELKSIPTRMVAGMWWFFTLLMVSSYTANLAAFLTTESPDPHFTNFRELVNNAEEKGIKYGAKNGGATADFFRNKAKQEPDSDFGKAWAHMEKYKDEVMISENKDGVLKAEQGGYAFFMETTSIEYETQRRCNLEQVGNRLDEKGYAIAMRKNAPYRNSLSTAILMLQNSGTIDEIKRRWWEERRGGGACGDETSDSNATPLTVKNVEGVFGVTILGTILAALLAVAECIGHTFKKSIRNKTPFKEGLKAEMMFYLKFGEMVKPVANTEESSHKSQSVDKGLQYGFVDAVNPNSTETLRSNSSSLRSRKSKRSQKKLKKQTTDNTA